MQTQDGTRRKEELVVISEDDCGNLCERENKVSNDRYRSRSLSTPKELREGDMTDRSRDQADRTEGHAGMAGKWKQGKWLGQKLMQSNVSDVMDKFNNSHRKSLFKLADAMFEPKMSRFIGVDKELISNDQDYHNSRNLNESNLKSSSPSKSKLQSDQKRLHFQGSVMKRNEAFLNRLNNVTSQKQRYLIEEMNKNDLIDEEEIRKQQKSATKASGRYLRIPDSNMFHIANEKFQ